MARPERVSLMNKKKPDIPGFLPSRPTSPFPPAGRTPKLPGAGPQAKKSAGTESLPGASPYSVRPETGFLSPVASPVSLPKASPTAPSTSTALPQTGASAPISHPSPTVSSGMSGVAYPTPSWPQGGIATLEPYMTAPLYREQYGTPVFGDKLKAPFTLGDVTGIKGGLPQVAERTEEPTRPHRAGLKIFQVPSAGGAEAAEVGPTSKVPGVSVPTAKKALGTSPSGAAEGEHLGPRFRKTAEEPVTEEEERDTARTSYLEDKKAKATEEWYRLSGDYESWYRKAIEDGYTGEEAEARARNNALKYGGGPEALRRYVDAQLKKADKDFEKGYVPEEKEIEAPEFGLPDDVLKEQINNTQEDIKRRAGQIAQSFSYSAGRAGMPAGLIQAGMGSIANEANIAAANVKNAITLANEQMKNQRMWEKYNLDVQRGERQKDRNFESQQQELNRQFQAEWARIQASMSPEWWEYLLGGGISLLAGGISGFAGGFGTSLGKSIFS